MCACKTHETTNLPDTVNNHVLCITAIKTLLAALVLLMLLLCVNSRRDHINKAGSKLRIENSHKAAAV